ncbi:hypothetical protein [Streptacidiphilus sp. EB129]|jgi:hypothetical protein|uniref:hypothetical protein n=1 Tax=Streptacidiphilus sp. EB129 TaxID=3156262 RepID=UPI003513F189
MAHLLIEENFRHLDGEDVGDLIEGLSGLGLRAEPTQPRTSPGRHTWVLVLHWLRDDVTPITDDSLVASVVDAVRGVLLKEHPAGPGGTRVQERTLPARIDIRGRSGELIRSVAVPGAV